MLNNFYKRTKYLWKVSRIILIIFFGVAILNRLSEIKISDLIVNALFLILITSMITISVFEFLKKEPYFYLRFLVGIFNVLFGILLCYLILTLGKTDYAVHIQIGFQIIPLWIVLYGLFEISNGIKYLKNKKLIASEF